MFVKAPTKRDLFRVHRLWTQTKTFLTKWYFALVAYIWCSKRYLIRTLTSFKINAVDFKYPSSSDRSLTYRLQGSTLLTQPFPLTLLLQLVTFSYNLSRRSSSNIIPNYFVKINSSKTTIFFINLKFNFRNFLSSLFLHWIKLFQIRDFGKKH